MKNKNNIIASLFYSFRESGCLRIFFLLLAFWGTGSVYAAAQAPERHDMRKGNKLYKQHEYDKAEIAYKHGLEKDSTSFGARFNVADALYKQGKTENAEKLFQSLTGAETDDERKAKVFHNLGNAQLKQQKYEESIKSYKQSLRLNPADDETRTNLAYAQAMLQQQQQEQQNNQNNQDNQDNQDKNQDRQGQDKQQDQDNKGQQDEQQQQQQPDQQNQQEQPQDKQNEQQQQQKISPQDAQRMLEAVQADEKETQDKVNKEKAKALQRQQIEKNW
ncbi:MAG: tetratricopeptide repeat protein [Prevotellaceae bacterium]|jgi:tetratricopeptide (TPR) repeat protein|nr:tetratricopeptide repeat protein [Prevotellaceae bacterium]